MMAPRCASRILTRCNFPRLPNIIRHYAAAPRTKSLARAKPQSQPQTPSNPEPTPPHHTFRRTIQHLYNELNPHILLTTTLLSLTFLTYHALPMLPTAGPSMLPTLLVRDGVIWSPLHRRGRGIKVGDIVAARSPYEPGEAVVKRVLGLAGDVVCVSRGPRLASQHHGVGAADEWQSGDERAMDVMADAKYITVPRGHCWVEGDNPPWSVDSRHYGPLPLGLVVGKVVAVRGATALSWRWVGSDALQDVEEGSLA